MKLTCNKTLINSRHHFRNVLIFISSLPLATKSGFPTLSDLNARLRRLIASYQRENRKEAARKAQRDKRQIDRRERFEQAVRDREQKKRDVEQRWSRREEIEFYKVITNYGPWVKAY